MTIVNNTQIELYNQIILVSKCADAFKDVYGNIPEDDPYSAVFSIIGDRLYLEIAALMPLVLGIIEK